jgi:CHAD domain-containing protein
MDSELREAHEAAVSAAAAALGSVRYFRLLDALDELVWRPPWTPLALGSADDVLRPCVRAEWKRLRRRVRAAQAAEPGHDRDEHLHEVRKAAKRLRYAAEAVEAAFGAKAARFAAAAESIQEVLGDLNDSVVTRALLRQLAAESAGRPGNALLYGRMHAAEERHAARAEAQFDAAWHACSRRRLRRWLRS